MYLDKLASQIKNDILSGLRGYHHNLGLNIEKDYPNGHEDFNKKWDNINETIEELSNQTIGSYLHSTKNQRRERQFENGKQNALDTINKRYSFGCKLISSFTSSIRS